MTKITITKDNKQTREQFLDFIEDTYNSMKEANLSDTMIVPHISGMAMAAEWFGVLSHDDSESLIIAILLDACEP